MVLCMPGSVLFSRSLTIFAARMLNFCVRHGYRCVHPAFTTRPELSLKTGQQSLLGKAFDLLVSVRWGYHYPCTPDLSTLSSLRGLLLAYGSLILKWISRLDAFSVYSFHTWLPSCATGVTTGPPSVCPSRSSRTEDRSSQTSCAHDR